MKRIRYYEDELNDDFADNYSSPPRVIDSKYKYKRTSPIWHLFSFILYYVIAIPLGSIICAFGYGVKIKNRKKLSQIKSGCYIYGNHTHLIIDAFIPAILSWPRHAFVIAGPRSVSLPLLPLIVPMLGGVPLNESTVGKKRFRQFLRSQTKKGNRIAIMPEAHLWPYYNGIRNFSERSFTYPVREKKPVVGYVLTYRRRKFLKSLPPLVTVTVSDPVLPSEWRDSADPKLFLRDRILEFMKEAVERERSFEYIKYRPKPKRGKQANKKTKYKAKQGIATTDQPPTPQAK